MRSKIEANEYKDYILGFIFYKFLSDKEVEYLKKNDWEDADLSELVEEDTDIVEQCKKNIGYFISYENLFSTWLKKGKDFDVSNITDALSAFDQRHLVRSIEFACLFSCVRCKIGNQILIDETKHVISLSFIHRDILYQSKQVTDCLCSCTACLT